MPDLMMFTNGELPNRPVYGSYPGISAPLSSGFALACEGPESQSSKRPTDQHSPATATEGVATAAASAAPAEAIGPSSSAILTSTDPGSVTLVSIRLVASR